MTKVIPKDIIKDYCISSIPTYFPGLKITMNLLESELDEIAGDIQYAILGARGYTNYISQYIGYTDPTPYTNFYISLNRSLSQTINKDYLYLINYHCISYIDKTFS